MGVHSDGARVEYGFRVACGLELGRIPHFPYAVHKEVSSIGVCISYNSLVAVYFLLIQRPEEMKEWLRLQNQVRLLAAPNGSETISPRPNIFQI